MPLALTLVFDTILNNLNYFLLSIVHADREAVRVQWTITDSVSV